MSLVDYMGGDPSVERAARVSYGDGEQHVDQAQSRSVQDTRGLIRYLHRHEHTTPTEMVEMVFHCCMPIFVARQWVRHRTASINEVSARYSVLPNLFYTPEGRVFAGQSASNKQGREDEALDEDLYEGCVEDWHVLRDRTTEHYEAMLRHGVARELARIDLPLSVYTQWYWKIDLKNLLHFLRLRVDPHAQYEIRAYAEIMAGMVERVAPVAYRAWLDYDVGSVRFSHAERRLLARLVVRHDDDHLDGVDTLLSRSTMAAEGLGEREQDEFMAKFGHVGQWPQVDDYRLDPTDALTAARMRERQRA